MSAAYLSRVAAGVLMPGHAYVQAQRVRRLWCDAILSVFDEVDVLIHPADNIAGPQDRRRDAVGAALDRAARPTPWNLTGAPAIAIPTGISAAEGMPLSMQCVAAPGNDAEALLVAHAFQLATDFHKARPPLSARTPPRRPPARGSGRAGREPGAHRVRPTRRLPGRPRRQLTGARDVLVHLRDQLLGRAEALLVAQALDEVDPHRLAVDVAAVVVEQERLEPQRRPDVGGREGRGDADVDRGGAAAAGEHGPAGVHAAARKRGVGRDLQVRRREAERAAAAVAGDDDALDRVHPPEQRDDGGDLAGGHEPPDAGGRDRLVVGAGDHGGRLDPERARAAELGQHLHGPAALVAEPEVLAHHDGVGADGGATSISAKRSARMRENARVKGTTSSSSTPSRSISWVLKPMWVSTAGRSSGRRTAIGCGSKVSAIDPRPRSAASSMARPMTAW